MNTTEPTCADRIEQNLKGREADVQAIFDSEEYIDELALSIVTKKITIVTLSWGGPADYLEVTHDQHGIEKVIYRFSDWYDTAETRVDSDSPLWQYAENILETMEA